MYALPSNCSADTRQKTHRMFGYKKPDVFRNVSTFFSVSDFPPFITSTSIFLPLRLATMLSSLGSCSNHDRLWSSTVFCEEEASSEPVTRPATTSSRAARKDVILGVQNWTTVG